MPDINQDIQDIDLFHISAPEFSTAGALAVATKLSVVAAAGPGHVIGEITEVVNHRRARDDQETGEIISHGRNNNHGNEVQRA